MGKLLVLSFPGFLSQHFINIAELCTGRPAKHKKIFVLQIFQNDVEGEPLFIVPLLLQELYAPFLVDF